MESRLALVGYFRQPLAMRIILAALVLLSASCRESKQSEAVEIVAALVDFDKLDTLKGDRAANGRVRKIAYWLEASRRDGEAPEDVLESAYKLNGQHGTVRAIESTQTTLANLVDLEAWGCFNPEGMGKLRRGNAPTITKGPHAGQIVSVDHTLPRSVVDELDERLFNLRVMPERSNQSKGSRITLEEVQIARRWHAQGLLSEGGLRAVERAGMN